MVRCAATDMLTKTIHGFFIRRKNNFLEEHNGCIFAMAPWHQFQLTQ